MPSRARVKTRRLLALLLTTGTIIAALAMGAGIASSQDRSPRNACDQCTLSGAADCHAACMPQSRQTEPLQSPGFASGQCDQCTLLGAADCHAVCMPQSRQTEPLGSPSFAWGQCERCTLSGAADCHAACMPQSEPLGSRPIFPSAAPSAIGTRRRRSTRRPSRKR